MNFNMSRSTMIGRIIIPEKVRDNEGYLHQKAVAVNDLEKIKDKDAKVSEFNREGAFVEDYSSGNWLIFGNRWLGLMSYKELLNYVIDYYTKVKETDATIMDNFNHILDKNPKYKKLPWEVKTSSLYNDELMFNRKRVPFTFRTQITTEARNEIYDYYSKLRMY